MYSARTDVLVKQSHYMTIIPYNEPLFTNGKLNGINTWRDWHLLPTSRPVFEPPKVKTNYIDLPGGDGIIDATDTLTSYPVYSNREGSNEFYVITGYGNWANRFSDIMDYLHGQKVRVILETDPSYYYEGRLSVNQWQSEKDHSKITIDYSLYPYKFDIHSSLEPWLWDPFNFYDGIIRREGLYKDLVLEMGNIGDGWQWDPFNFYYGVITSASDTQARLIVPIVARSMPCVPSFIIQKGINPGGENQSITIIKYKADGTTIDVAHEITPEDYAEHTYKFPDIVLRGANNKLAFICGENSLFYISIDFRCGRL